jgi:hypothetical protein
MTIEEHIQAASAKNAALLQTLSQTDYAKPALRQQTSYITDLENDLLTLRQRLAELDRRRTRDLKDHVKYRDSVFRRFAYKATGRREKFEEKAGQEEKAYFEGMQESNTKSEEKRQLDGLLEEARAREATLEREVKRHDAAQVELDGLYDSIFSGPNPHAKYPEEDRLEREAETVLGEYESFRQSLEGEERALKLLNDARREINMALQHISSALGYSTWDMWGGGTMVDMMERNELSSADRRWSAVKMLHAEARRASQQVGPLPQVRVAAGSLMSDVFFDNIFTDMAFHEKIQKSQAEMKRAADELMRHVLYAEQRVKDGQSAVQTLSAKLEKARVALQDRRTEIFRMVAAQS